MPCTAETSAGFLFCFYLLLSTFDPFVVDLLIENQVGFFRLWSVESMDWLEEQPLAIAASRCWLWPSCPIGETYLVDFRVSRKMLFEIKWLEHL